MTDDTRDDAEAGESGVTGERVVLALAVEDGCGEGVMGESVVGDVTEREEMLRERAAEERVRWVGGPGWAW